MSGFTEEPGFAEKLKSQPAMKALLMGKAKRVTDLAGVLAAHQSGNYQRTLDTDWDPSDKVARALSTDIAGHLIEFGGAKNVAQAPLRRAADVVCDGFKAAPKP